MASDKESTEKPEGLAKGKGNASLPVPLSLSGRLYSWWPHLTVAAVIVTALFCGYRYWTRQTMFNPLEGVSPVAGNSVGDVQVILPKELLDAVRHMSRGTGWMAQAEGTEVQSKNNAGSPHNTDKYFTRSFWNHCDSAKGMWFGEGSQPVAIYKYETVAQLFGLGKMHVVLDWGAGCGHQIDLVAGKTHCSAVGLDLVPANAKWAMSHLSHIKSFRVADGSSLPFQDNTFDAILSNAALYHLASQEDQCMAAKGEILRVLKPQGCAWFGWLGSDDAEPRIPKEFWRECFKGTSAVAAAFTEQDLFGVSEYGDQHAYSLFFCKQASSKADNSTVNLSNYPGRRSKLIRRGSTQASTEHHFKP